MKIKRTIFALGLFALAASANAQQTLIEWNHTWSYMHPMGEFPDVPPGGDTDFDSTWFLSEGDFSSLYNGPEIGATPRLTGDPLILNSFDSGVSEAPIGYGTIDYFTEVGAEFIGFGDDDGDAGNGLNGELTTPAGGERRAAYFRTTFTVPAGDPLVNPTLRYLFDDGAYVYLDGELILRVNMAATTPENLDTYTGVNAAGTASTEIALRVADLSLAEGATTGALETDGTGANAVVVKRLLSLDPGEHTLAVSLRSNNATSSDMVLAAELTASEGCAIVASASNVVRSDNGTPLDGTDDTFTFDIDATGVNTAATWTVSPAANAGGTSSGSYGVTTTVGPFPIAFSPLTATVADSTDTSCTADVTVTAPAATISAAASGATRDLKATIDRSDDTFMVNVTVNAQFASAGWTATSSAVSGVPASGSYGVPVAFGPFLISDAPVAVTFADSVDPALTVILSLSGPEFIGATVFGGFPADLLSEGALDAGWNSDEAVSPTVTFTNVNVDEWREFRSDVIDLSARGEVAFFAELVARDTSTGSNFESLDAFRAKLVITDGGTTEVDLIAPFDTDSNGMMNGSDNPYVAAEDEFNANQEAENVQLNNSFFLQADIPASATAVQLVVEAKNMGGSEAVDVRRITFNDDCVFEASAFDAVRNLQGDPGNPAAHTVEFVLRADSTGLVSPAGWDVVFDRGAGPIAGANISGGLYDAETLVTGLPAEGGPITAKLTDRGDSSCTFMLTIDVPGPPVAIGSLDLGGGIESLYSAGPAANWTVIASGLELRNAPGVSPVESAPVDLSAVSGDVYFSMTLHMMETSGSSNFEPDDIFSAELVLNDGVSDTIVSLTDLYDTDASGEINGGTEPIDDEFNPSGQAESESLDNLFPMTAIIPDGTISAVLRFSGDVNSDSETMQVLNILFSTTPPVGGGDSDGDGVSDTDELIAGTDPNEASSVFKVTALTAGAPGTVNAGFESVAGRFYQGYYSTDLITWTRDDSVAEIAGDGNPMSWPFTPVPNAGDSERFLRIAVSATSGSFPATMP